MAKPKENDRRVISFLTLRKALGILGLSLPVILSLGCFLMGECPEIQDSMSAYYHTGMRDVFVGVLFAIGLFLYSYKGHEPIDDRMGDLGCIFAVGVAVFPTSDVPGLIPTLHFISAGLLFGVFSFFSLALFTKMGGKPTNEKRQRNVVYRTCGVIMLLCIALIAAYSFFGQDTFLSEYKPVFFLEFLALLAFGFSWLVKGETLWADQ